LPLGPNDVLVHYNFGLKVGKFGDKRAYYADFAGEGHSAVGRNKRSAVPAAIAVLP
jgi:hypothetical protein